MVTAGSATAAPAASGAGFGSFATRLGGLGLAGQLLDQRQRLLQLVLAAGAERELVALALERKVWV